ncbi:MAG: trigger factor [Bacteroidales bacterium]|nr:trigger factor [Bacteroidales bacterium]
MKVTKKKADALNYQLTIQVAAEDYAEPLRKRLNDYRRKADIKGFRRGMAPMSLIQRMYGDQCLYESVNGLVGESLDNFIKKEKIRIVGEPMPSEDQPQLSWKAGEDFTFKFDIAQTPEINFEVNKEDKVVYYDINITAAEKKAQKEQLLQQYGSLQEGKKAGENDYIVADIENEGHKAEGVYVSVSHVAEEARGAFIGKKAGDKFQLDVNAAFPNETDRAAMLKVEKGQLANLDPLFTFTVVNVKTYVAAEENQETYDKIFGEGVVTTPEQFEEKVAEQIKASHEQEANYRFGADVRKYFVEKAALELPEAFLKRWLVYANEGKFSAEQVEKEFPAFIEDFKWQLVRGYIMQKFNLKVTREDILAAARSFVAYQYAMYGMAGVPQNLIDSSAENMLQDQNQYRRLEEQCEDNIAIAKVREEVTLQSKKISMETFSELK